jgi:hypothetical protein
VQANNHKRVPSRIHRERIAHLACEGKIGSTGTRLGLLGAGCGI